MATTIKLKNGSGAPLAGDLVQGEPALDLTNKRLYTEDSGGTVIEVGTNPGTDVTFADNRKAIFGAGSDLQIYHDGSNSYIKDAATGELYIQGDESIRFTNSAGTETLARFISQNRVDLYYDNAIKLATTSSGIDVTGDVNSDSVTTGTFTSTGIDDNAASTAITIDSSQDVTFTSDAKFPDSGKAIFGAGSDLQIYHDGSNSYIEDVNATTDLIIRSYNRLQLKDKAADEMFINCKSNDAVELYYDGAFKFSTTSTGIDVTGQVVSSDSFKLTTNVSTPTGNTMFRPDSNTLAFGTNSIERMRIDSNGNVGIGETSPARTLDVNSGTSNVVARFASTDFTASLVLEDDNGTPDSVLLNCEAGAFTIDVGGGDNGASASEAMRIDSSGNLLVGTTSTTPAFGTATGIALVPTGESMLSANSATTLFLNRTTSDGTILDFRKDGTTVGSIFSYNGFLGIGSPSGNDAYLLMGSDFVAPATSTGAARDGAIDLGSSGRRFKDIYATNGTIQTSDRNEKQDIEELSDAEQRVAVACKGLLRKFRWKSAVEEKGDDARIHFGIIAKDLQAAFEAEGLDAGDYAMFIHSTWTDEETGEERSRMGVRYSELLAFIIAAI